MTETTDRDSRALLFALFAATTMIAQQVAGKATRDALFLSNFDVTDLPKMVIAAAVSSMAGVLVISQLLTRISPTALVPAAFGLSAVLFVGEWLLLDYHPGLASIALYLHMAIFGAILISGFWSIINERFDPHSAKRRVARIAAAATLGGVIGGLLANRVVHLMDVRTMLLFLSGLHLVCLVAIRGIGTPLRALPVETATRTSSAFTVIRHTHYLQWMAALMVLIAVMAALVDYAFKAEAAARYQDSGSLVTFFATFYASVGVLGFLLQSLLGRQILQRFGIGTTIAILPAVIVMFGTLGSVVTQLWTMIMLRGSQAIFVTSLFRSAFELLYTPLPPHKKRPTKTIIDVASDRIGDLLGSGLILLLLWLIPNLPTAIVTTCAVIAALLGLLVITRLNRGYINQLARSLRKGVVRIEEHDIVDATTQQILAESNAYSEREFLQSKIAAMREFRSEDRDAAATDSENEITRHAQAVKDLCSNDTGRIQFALNSGFIDIHLTPYLIPLLANDEVAEDVRTELRWLVPRIAGQLTDAMLDPDLPLLARQRIPGVLEASHNPRAIDGLLQGLMDSCFNIRFSCARALARMRSRNAQLSVDRETVFSAIRDEIRVSEDEWEAHNLQLNSGDSSEKQPEIPIIHQNLEHVFTLLSLTLDPNAVHISMQATFSTDANLRGTALEYLENVLPTDLYDSLVLRLGMTDEVRAGTRHLSEIIRELKLLVRHSIT